MQPHAGSPQSPSSSLFGETTTDPSRAVAAVGEPLAEDRRFHESRSALTPLFEAQLAMTSRMGVPRLTRMTVISPVFLMCARTVIMPSSAAGAAADGFADGFAGSGTVVTEELLSLVGTRAGRKLISAIVLSERTRNRVATGRSGTVSEQGRRRNERFQLCTSQMAALDSSRLSAALTALRNLRPRNPVCLPYSAPTSCGLDFHEPVFFGFGTSRLRLGWLKGTRHRSGSGPFSHHSSHIRQNPHHLSEVEQTFA